MELSAEMVAVLKGGGVMVFAFVVWLQLRDQTKLLQSINRKQARIETVQLDARRPTSAITPVFGVPVSITTRAAREAARARTNADSDAPELPELPAQSRTITTDADG